MTQHEHALPRDEFTARRRALTGHPEAVAVKGRIDVEDPYGSVVTWIMDLIRVDGRVTAFVQRTASDGLVRLVIPPEVTAAISRHQAGLVKKQRRKTARRVAADKRARGEVLGNPEALKKARRVKAAKRDES